MYIYILFGLYSLLLILLFGYLAIFVMHIKDFLMYSRYLSKFLKVYLITLAVLTVFGGYMILTDSTPRGTQTYTDKGEY